MQKAREDETGSKRQLRLTADRENKKQKKLSETLQETEKRKTRNRDQKTQSRKDEREEETRKRQMKQKERDSQNRKDETEEETRNRKRKDKERKSLNRKDETEEETGNRKMKDKELKSLNRENETSQQRLKRCIKNRENMSEIRNNRSELKRLQKFEESVRYGPIFTCTVCEQDMFRNSVTILTDKLENEINVKSSELYNSAFKDKHPVKIWRCAKLEEEPKLDVECYICITCKRHLKKGNLPPMAAANGLDIVKIKDKDLHLTELENNLIAKKIIFQKIYQLPKSRMAACKDRLVNIPISSEDVINTLESLPRTPKEAGLLEVKLKRKLEYKNVHQQAYIDPKKIYKALAFLKKNGHPDYEFYDDYSSYNSRCKQSEKLKATIVNDDNVEMIQEKSEYLNYLENNPDLDQGSDEDEEEFRKKDVVRKYQFDYDSSVCLVDKFPEAAITEDFTPDKSDEISFAPGEGKIPESILSSTDWDMKAFPMKHPDGRNNLHQDRPKKLSDQYYFVQRLRNKDPRFCTDPAYVFASAAYLEKKQLQRNVNVSFQRGKEVRSGSGPSTYHLEDGFSVFDSISNTPKYWKTAKYEMLAKLDNLGPFHFFFTLSCADRRWEENFSSILRKLDIKIVYKTDSEGVQETLVQLENGENGEMMKMQDYLEQHVDSSLHEMIRTHVFIATRNYNNRVKSFIRDIMTDKNNPMHVKYWSTKVEFQGRGAGHNHGTIWVDIERMEMTYVDQEGRWMDLDSLISSGNKMEVKQELRSLLEEYFVKGTVFKEEDAQKLYGIYKDNFEEDVSKTAIDEHSDQFVDDFLRQFPLFGLSKAFKKFQTKEDLLDHEERAIITFANKFTTCTLNEAVIASKTEDKELKNKAADVVEIVRVCYVHSHTKSCRKYHTQCRFGFAKFPMWRTILTRPLKDTGESGKMLKKKYDEILTKVKEIISDKEVIKTILDEYPKDDDTSKEKYESNRKKRIVKMLNMVGLHTNDEIQMYEEALTYSTPGYTLILERDLDELYVNSYNPEWARAWNGNTDLQVCLDYFAVITYITEYYTKDDTGMMTKLIEMLKNSECETLKEKMILVMNTFISARQMGECEAYFKIMPDLHLKDSNVSTVFVPTSRKSLRSKFMIRVEENDDYGGREKKKIENRKGWYVEKYDVIDKYVRRDKTQKASDSLCPAQFFKMYATYRGKQLKQESSENTPDSEDNDEAQNEAALKEHHIHSNEKFHYVMTASTDKKPIPLQDIIEIENPYPGEAAFMKKRSAPVVLRFHKPKQSVDPAAYFFSEALLYTSFRSEEELETRVNNAAIDGYEALENEINAVKSQVMEYLESNQEARYMVEEASEKAKEMGDTMDPAGEQDIEDCVQEELLMHPDYQHLNPDDLESVDRASKTEKVYRPIQVDDLKLLREKTRRLDFYQRKAVERGIMFSRDVVKALRNENSSPEAKTVIVHGGAGSGKTTVINILKQWCHLILQQSGDNPECPYVLVAAPTGTAAANIRGQTMHSAFSFSFGNEHFSLSDMVRDKKRNHMKNLRIVIIDEISMMKSDQQFQLDKRLREVTQKPAKLFGGAKLFLFGDIMQLKPCRGRYMFEEPINPDYKLDFHLGTHWQSFEVINLEENHRQGEDMTYATMLNRFRVGQQTEVDMQTLQSRVRPLNHPDLKGAVFIACKNKEVAKLNSKRLKEINEETMVFEAINVHPTIKNFKPPIKPDKGTVKDTPFMQTLTLKKGARVQLTYNINTADCLTNGTRGEVTDYVKNTAGIVEMIMIKFDEVHQGQQKREANLQLTSVYPDSTSIERVIFQYSLAKKSKNVANTAKVIQFPLRLCFAATAHGFQGQTVYKPNKSANDFCSVFEAAQSYVMLSRVQALSQLFIIGRLPDNKFYASPKALKELERLNRISINNNPPVWEQPFEWSLKIAALNCQSLRDKLIDLQNDPILAFSDIICLSETWLKDDVVREDLHFLGYDLHLNSIGAGKGIATYFKTEKVSNISDIKKQRVQITKLSSPDVDVFSVYRSSGADNLELAKDLQSIINCQKTTIICGDFNLGFVTERQNKITKLLEECGFTQLVNRATHLMGGCIDHVYTNHNSKIFDVDVQMYSPYYTSLDHDALCITIRRIANFKT